MSFQSFSNWRARVATASGVMPVVGGLIAATGAIKPLGALVARIPDGIAGAMLAGVLLPFCLKGTGAAQSAPLLIFPMVAVFALVRLKNPAMAVLAALALGLALAFATGAAMLPPLPALPTVAPPCTAQCYTYGSDDGPECHCTGPRPCQTSISAGACG